MSTAHTARPETVMGRALSVRALALAQTLPAAAAPGPDEIDLTTPETLAVPEHVRIAAGAALDRGETHYTTRPGVVALREAIAQRLSDDGFPATADTVLVTNGGAEALYIALQMLAPARRIVVAGPVSANVIQMIHFIGADPVHVSSGIEDRFFPSAESIVAADGSVLLLASPSPVTGAALRPDALETAIETAIGRGMTVILDRSLAAAHYDPTHSRFGNPELGSQVVTIGSFSTAYGLAGWRVGWLASPPETMNQLRDLKQAMSICTTAVSQYAALAALEGPPEWVGSRRAEFARRRDRVMTRLHAAGLVPVDPDAYAALTIDVRVIDGDDRRFAARLRAEEGVVVEAGSVFGPATAGFVRIDLSVPAAILSAGIARLVSFAERGRAQ